MVTTRPARAWARSSSWEATTTVAPAAAACAHQAVDHVAGLGVEAGVGLVEQPQLGSAGHQHRDRRPAALAGRQPGHGHVAQPAVEAQRGERGLGVGRPARAARAQKRTLSATVSSS